MVSLSQPGGTMRTMQSDLKKIQESKQQSRSLGKATNKPIEKPKILGSESQEKPKINPIGRFQFNNEHKETSKAPVLPKASASVEALEKNESLPDTEKPPVRPEIKFYKPEVKRPEIKPIPSKPLPEQNLEVEEKNFVPSSPVVPKPEPTQTKPPIRSQFSSAQTPPQFKVTPRPQPEPEIKAEPEPEYIPQPEPRADISSEDRLQPQFQTKPKPKPQFKPQPEIQPEAEPRPKFQFQSKPRPEPVRPTSTLEPEMAAEPESESQLPPQDQSRFGAQSRSKPIPKMQPEPEYELPVEPEPLTEPEPKVEAKPLSRFRPQPQPQPQPQPELTRMPEPEPEQGPKPQMASKLEQRVRSQSQYRPSPSQTSGKIQEREKPLVKLRSNAVPEDFIKVVEHENKEELRDLFKREEPVPEKARPVVRRESRVQHDSFPESDTAEEEYLPPELRLYRSAEVTSKNIQDTVPVAENNMPGVNEAAIPGTKRSMSGMFKKVIGLVVVVALIGGVVVYVLPILHLDNLINNIIGPKPSASPSTNPYPSFNPESFFIPDTIAIKVSDAKSLKSELLSLRGKQAPPVSVLSVMVSDETSNTSVLDTLGIIIPENVKNDLIISSASLLYFSQDGRLGLTIQVNPANTDAVWQDMRSWEEAKTNAVSNPIVNSLSPLLLDSFYEIKSSVAFKDGTYKNIPVRFVNLPDTARAIDYTVVKGYLVIVTSKSDMSAVIDEAMR